jgi:hypothetical protein
MVKTSTVLLILLAFGAMARGEDTTRPSDTSILFNLYDLQRPSVLQSAVDALTALVQPRDVFVLVSGNHKGAADIPLIAQWSAKLHERFAGNEVWVLTSGLANVKLLADSRDKLPSVSTIVYDYEPKWDNEPEFDADFDRTIANFTRATTLAHGAHLKLVGAPTGRPLLKNDFARYGWDYGKLAKASGADGMLVQTQTYAKKSVADFQQAMAKLKAQQTAAALPLDHVYPQITVDLNSTNGASITQAVACAHEVRHAGFGTLSLWFAPAHCEVAVAFLKALGRKEQPRP